MTQLFANNAASELASAVASGDVSLTLKSGDGAKFPGPVGGDFFLVTLYQKVGQDEINHEIVKCTARAGDVLTIERAQEGTTARAFNVDDPVELRLTAGALVGKQDAVLVFPYDSRASLRSTTGTYAVVEGLGLFRFAAGSDEPDDDESCFATGTGRWLLEAAHWDLVDSWQAPDRQVIDDDLEEFAATQTELVAAKSDLATTKADLFTAQTDISNLQARWPGRVLFGTAASSITSVAAGTQVSFTGTVTGAAVGGRVVANPPNALGALIAAYARVTAADTITVYLNNPSAASQTIATGTWQLAVFKDS